MNYLTNYYKNLCEQLQEKINILEAEIYSPEGKFMKGSEKFPRDFNALLQGEKRKEDVESLKAALADKSHPIHKNPEHVAHVQRVIADIESLRAKEPGSSIASELTQHAVGEKESPRSSVEFGWASSYPKSGRATAKHMRTAVEVMRKTYQPNPIGGHVTPSQY